MGDDGSEELLNAGGPSLPSFKSFPPPPNQKPKWGPFGGGWGSKRFLGFSSFQKWFKFKNGFFEGFYPKTGSIWCFLGP